MTGGNVRKKLPTRKRISPVSKLNENHNDLNSGGSKSSATKRYKKEEVNLTDKEFCSEDNDDHSLDENDKKKKENDEYDEQLHQNDVSNITGKIIRRSRRQPNDHFGAEKSKKHEDDKENGDKSSEILGKNVDDNNQISNSMKGGFFSDEQSDDNTDEGNFNCVVDQREYIEMNEEDGGKDNIDHLRECQHLSTRSQCKTDSQNSDTTFYPLRAIMPSSDNEISVIIILSKQNNLSDHKKSVAIHTSRGRMPHSRAVPERKLPNRKSRAPPDMLDTSPTPFVPQTSQKRIRQRASTISQNQSKTDLSHDQLHVGAYVTSTPTSSRSRIRGGKVENSIGKSVIKTALVPDIRRSRRRNGSSDIAGFIGDDGNLFFCHFCNEVGEVVCCDGCPKVFHPTCIPKGPSKSSLDNDDDPWYCPLCYDSKVTKEEKKKIIITKSAKNKRTRHITKAKTVTKKKDINDVKNTSTPYQGRRRERRAKYKCTECKTAGGKLTKCKYCHVILHYPTCAIALKESKKTKKTNDATDDIIETQSLVCTNCRAQNMLDDEEEERSASTRYILRDEKSAKDEKKRKDHDEDVASTISNHTSDPDERHHIFVDKTEKKSIKKRKLRTNKKTNDLSTSEKDSKLRNKKVKLSTLDKKKYKTETKLTAQKGKSIEIDDEDNVNIQLEDEVLEGSESLSDDSEIIGRPIKLIPAFFLYLADVRYKIERALSRKDPKFKNRTHSLERNKIIAREGALWWKQISRWEKKTWEYRAVKDFEERVVEWKEDSLVQQMKSVSEYDTGEEENDGDSKTHRRNENQLKCDVMNLEKVTLISSLPKCPSPSTYTSNTTLLGLLQDMRFHPIPKVHPTRSRQDFNIPDYSQMAVPNIGVRGPINAHVGDECLGCARGWYHYCPILKRQFPAVEHRSKLQPPLSSLGATRVALNEDTDGYQTCKQDEHDETTTCRLSLSHRFDNVTQFFDVALSTKFPIVVNRANRDEGFNVVNNTRSFSNQRQMFECGKCGLTIYTNTGCVRCRRLLLIQNLSEIEPVSVTKLSGNVKDTEGKLHKMQTFMLGQNSIENDAFSRQQEGDKRIAAALLRSNWKPAVVMPYVKKKSIIINRAGERKNGKLIESRNLKDLTDSKNKTALSHQGKSFLYSDKEPKIISVRRAPPRQASNSNNGNNKNIQEFSRHSRRLATSIQKGSPDVQELAVAHKVEANNLQKKILSYAIAGVLLALLRRDPLNLFGEPVPVGVENYHKLITNPTDWKTIRQKTVNGDYTSFGAFISDVKLLCNNAIVYNPPGSIYSNTAKEISSVIEIMHKRASNWMTVIKNSHTSSFSKSRWGSIRGDKDEESTDSNNNDNKIKGNDLQNDRDPYRALRKTWPEAVYQLENGSLLLSQIRADFMRTEENEAAYYGALAIRRAATSASASCASFDTSNSIYQSCINRSATEDEELRKIIDKEVAKLINPLRLLDDPMLKEKKLINLLRCVQKHRVEVRTSSESGCARCDEASFQEEVKRVMKSEAMRVAVQQLKRNDSNKNGDKMINPNKFQRIAKSRLGLSTGLGSKEVVKSIRKDKMDNKNESSKQRSAIMLKSVSVRGSKIHGWGLFADHPFEKGEVVAEYVGEWVRNQVADKREIIYQERRIQDYQFRVTSEMVIDATLRGGYARYINHKCNPNCVAKIVDADSTSNKHLKRVMIISRRLIKENEELTYDYQFPIEFSLDDRIPCNCGARDCRSYMNWDLPERG